MSGSRCQSTLVPAVEDEGESGDSSHRERGERRGGMEMN
jgi:hypothetical protein